jgi:hypothetical protein
MSNVSIQIIYKSSASGSSIMQRGDFPLKGRRPETIAFHWWEQIQKEMFVADLEQMIIDGEDMTETIKKMDKKIEN